MTSTVWQEVQAARAAAHAKHGANSIESVPGGDPRWLPILVEEVGEVAHEATYDATGDLRAELIDTLAVASAWVDAIDRARHSQPGLDEQEQQLVDADREEIRRQTVIAVLAEVDRVMPGPGARGREGWKERIAQRFGVAP